MNSAVDEMCTCMDFICSPPDFPGEHAESCPLRRATVEYRSHIPGVPHEADDCWTTDREEAEDEVDAFHALGDTRYRLDWRLVAPASDESEAS